jgi:cellulose synthase/poly-beta-1,6-N-acetylglucosamine synthase-like glycosyltransferase
MIALDIVLFTALGIPVLGCTMYLLVLSIFAVPSAPKSDERSPRLRFDIVVPAHDEEAGIAATIGNLGALDYPKDLYRILVIADNCTDATARTAKEAGAMVLERRDPERRGKGYALAYAFEQVQKDGIADAVVVIDADSTAAPNLLRAFARRFEAGANAVQATYGVRNPDASWRTRLMVIALALFHVLRSLGRERLGLSAGLRGNGMGLSREVLRRVPHDAFSIVEDLEYGIKLGYAGHRVHYVPEAFVFGDMASRGRASGSQRRRWEQGRAAIARAIGPKLLLEGVLRRDAVLLDLAMDLLVPPLASIALAAAVGTALAVAWHRMLGGSPAVVIPWLLSIGFIAVYVLRGVSLSGTGIRGLLALLWAPVYVIWKIGLRFRRSAHGSNEWIRTEREGARR